MIAPKSTSEDVTETGWTMGTAGRIAIVVMLLEQYCCKICKKRFSKGFVSDFMFL